MNIKTKIKAGGIKYNHNERLVSPKKFKDLIVKTGVIAGQLTNNHNEKMASDKSKSLVVKTNIKAGLLPAV
jgi:hypothetical protein